MKKYMTTATTTMMMMMIIMIALGMDVVVVLMVVVAINVNLCNLIKLIVHKFSPYEVNYHCSPLTSVTLSGRQFDEIDSTI